MDIPKKLKSIGKWKLREYSKSVYRWEHFEAEDGFGFPLIVTLEHKRLVVGTESYWQFEPPMGFKGYRKEFSDKNVALKHVKYWMKRHQDL